MNNKSQREQVDLWLQKISAAEKMYQPYYELINETRSFYKDSRHRRGGNYNIFWSTIETLKPFLYFKQPQFYIERQNKSSDPVERAACTILEKALIWNLSQFDFDSVIKYARNDFLISGTGLVWEQYVPEFTEVSNPANPEENITLKTDESVETIYIDPKDFLADCNKKGVWEDVEWIARRIYMSSEDVAKQFDLPDIVQQGDMCIYEIWDKKTHTVYWLSKAYPNRFLKVNTNVRSTKNFFPCPKPIWSTQTNDSIIPTPDYCLIKEMLNELNGINSRMRMTMQALKISGAYDNSFPELADILSKDITLISVNDFSRLRDSGGIRGIIDFVPLEQYIAALEQLSLRRQEVINSIFEITGVSDIMRGNSDSNETATAVVKKTNFGTLRNQDRQNDMQRFIRDLLRIKAEIICEYFSADKLKSFLPEELQKDEELSQSAVNLLKTEKLRGMMFSVETTNILNQTEENTATLSAVESLGQLVQNALIPVSQQPKLLPLYRSMIEAVVSTMPKARCFETVLEQVFTAVEQELSAPEPIVQPAEPTTEQVIALQKNALKDKELNLKAAIEADKLDFSRQELQAQSLNKAREAAVEAQKNVMR